MVLELTMVTTSGTEEVNLEACILASILLLPRGVNVLHMLSYNATHSEGITSRHFLFVQECIAET